MSAFRYLALLLLFTPLLAGLRLLSGREASAAIPEVVTQVVEVPQIVYVEVPVPQIVVVEVPVERPAVAEAAPLPSADTDTTAARGPDQPTEVGALDEALGSVDADEAAELAEAGQEGQDGPIAPVQLSARLAVPGGAVTATGRRRVVPAVPPPTNAVRAQAGPPPNAAPWQPAPRAEVVTQVAAEPPPTADRAPPAVEPQPEPIILAVTIRRTSSDRDHDGSNDRESGRDRENKNAADNNASNRTSASVALAPKATQSHKAQPSERPRATAQKDEPKKGDEKDHRKTAPSKAHVPQRDVKKQLGKGGDKDD